MLIEILVLILIGCSGLGIYCLLLRSRAFNRFINRLHADNVESVGARVAAIHSEAKVVAAETENQGQAAVAAARQLKRRLK
jgi:hypothetical protein